MNKFKKILLGALSVLTLGLFVVSTTEVNAANPSYGEYSLLASTISANLTEGDGQKHDGQTWSTGKYYLPTRTYNNNVITFQNNNYISNDIAISMDSKTWTNALTGGGARNIEFDLSSNQMADVTMYAYTTSKDKKVSIGGVETSISTSKQITKIAGVLTNSNNKIQINSSSGFAEIDYNVHSTTEKDVTFNYNYEGAPDSTVVNSYVGSKLTPVDEPSRTNYTFSGWYDNAACTGDAFDFDTRLTSDSPSTLYASWTDNSALTNLSITFVAEGQDNIVKNVYAGYSISDWPSNPTKLGYDFVGWYNGETLYTDGTVFTSEMCTNNALTLTAVFEKSNVAIDSSAILDLATLGSNLTEASNNFAVGKFVVNDTDTALQYSSSALKLTSNGSDSSNNISFGIPANSRVKVTVTGKTGSSSGDCTIAVKCNDTTQFINYGSQEAKTITIINSSNSIQSVYVYRDFLVENGEYVLNQGNKIGRTAYIYGIQVTSYSNNISNLLEAQPDTATGTKIRFIATISGTGVTSQAVITSWTITMSMAGKPDYVANFDSSFTSVAGKNGKEAADNTYYLIGTLSGIPVSYDGKTFSTKITVNLSDGTTITSNVVNHTISIVATV